MDRAGRSVMRWGVDDCALWAADIVKDALGYDPVAAYRGRYHSRFGALRYISANGGMQGLLQGAARRHGWKRIDPRWAKPGDVGLVWTITEGAAVQATAICRARDWFVARNERGFTTVQAENVPIAWSVLNDAEQPPVHGPAMKMGGVAPTYAANYDPVTIGVAILAVVGVTGASTFVAGAVGFVALSVLSVGFSLAASFLQPHTGLGSLGSDSSLSSGSSGVLGGQSTQASVQVTERQSLPYKRIIVGNAYVGGALFFEQVTPPYLTHGILINDGEISAVRSITIGTDTLLFSDLAPNSIQTPLSSPGQPNYPGNMRVSLRFGAVDQDADPLILARYPNVSLSLVSFANASVIGTMTNGAAALNETIKVALQSASYEGTGNLTAVVGADLGSGHSVTATGFCVTAPTDAALSSASVIVRLRASNDNSTWTDLYVSVAASYSANAAFTGTFSNSTAYRYYEVSIEEQNGDAGTHSIFVASFTLYTGSSTTIFRQRGIATYVGEYNFGGSTQDAFNALWGQVARPDPYLSVDGVKVYDPRDPQQLLDDETTWKWSNNASLVQAWYLTREFGGRIPKDKIDLDRVADAATYDDELVGCADGTLIKRYTIDGAIILNEKPYSVLPRLLSANRGYVLMSGGKVWVSSSRPKTPTFTIHDGIIAGGFTYQAAKAKRDLINRAQVVFVAEEQNYQTVNGPILDRYDLQATDGEVLPGTLSLDFTRDYRRAERLLKAYVDSSRLGKTITVPVDANILAVAADELIGSVGTWDSQLWPMAIGNYMVTGVGFSDDFSTVTLALTEYDASIESNWNPSVDEKPFTLASVNVG